MDTTVTGVIPVLGWPYSVTLTPGQRPVLPVGIAAALPATGTLVQSGPAGVEMAFDPRDPVAVYVWLRGHTEVWSTSGPSLLPPNDETPAGALN